MGSSAQTAISRELKGDIPQVMEAVMGAMGGHGIYGQMMVDDVSRIRMSPDLPEDKRERLVLSYHRMFLNMMAKNDQYHLDTSEFAGVSEDELKLMLRQSAIENMKVDPQFRQQMLALLNQESPDDLRKMLGVEVLESERAE